MIPKAKPHRRIIEQLRRMFSGTWTYEAPYWKYEDGRTVAAYSFSAATNDCDVDSRFMVRYLFTETQEEVILDQSFKVYCV